MAKIKDSGLTTKVKKNISRPGIHAKSGSSQLKSSKNIKNYIEVKENNYIFVKTKQIYYVR
jgi:hypothetical protein